ncbi:rod shape-determining protein MreC [Bdellovibrionota bacterium]
MLRFFLAYRRIIIVLLLIFFPVLLLSTMKSREGELKWYDRVILAITNPLQKGVTYVVDKSTSVFDNYVLLFGVKDENARLQEENRKLREYISSLREIEIENSRLRKLLLFKEKVATFMIPAEVIATDPLQTYQTLKINKGSLDGITRGMPVVTAEGVLGQVVKTLPRYSDVLLLSDTASSIDVLIQRTRARGILEGRGSGLARIKYLRRVDDVQLGDPVISSGLGGKFPKGIRIGTVKRVSKKRYGMTQEVEVQPSVDFGKLEEVFVVLRVGKEPSGDEEKGS